MKGTNVCARLGEDLDFSQKEAPGLKHLLDDYISPDVPVDSVDWRRRMLQVFKESVTDNTYQDLLAQHTDDEQQRIERFVAGEDPETISQGFVMGPSMGCREELAKMNEAHSIVHVSHHGVTVVKETKELVLKDQDWFHATARKMADFFGITVKETGTIGDVLVWKGRKGVCLQSLIGSRTGSYQGKVPKLGPQCRKRPKPYLRMQVCLRDPDHCQIC